MELREYILSYGATGNVGRFRTTTPFRCRRGQRVVIRSDRGLEIGRVLCEAGPEHAVHLPNTTLGKLLRISTIEDESRAEGTHRLAQEVLQAALDLARLRNLSVEILDGEALLDGKQVFLCYLPWDDFKESDLTTSLEARFKIKVGMQSLALPNAEADEDHHEHGCGRPGCGRSEGGGCSTCSTGGCSTCSTKDMNEVYARYRSTLNDARTPLL